MSLVNQAHLFCIFLKSTITDWVRFFSISREMFVVISVFKGFEIKFQYFTIHFKK